ncbi:MAG: VPLPA-CTERM sorting domain-containing protein [Gammaproteobacteria bacterium]|uniref:VPLPA-CTERM sorting domain-containing protein n=1 Tax=Oceanicoccus sp. TaxID=2691044 RepID=UPI002604A67B|nr:VPLPA-CTERM sorting domain-containing protein [Oceanicoccus sp.]MCP3908418.1 VPLPA-CTERM sorting domain-containing protein [Oceanicoccus sp.]MCP4089474.1 VPLPA-CTERM sorting domain-containing protein [Gammaproteobacteria bacterium]MCP4278285.1 VPLPA-CTERM sorting domain-containing protein [Gammaproteobacteria bacterium]MCP4833047.1 VPLPA-CTERM sorting domain-containing protein [Gammaproteobacteria bacterium]
MIDDGGDRIFEASYNDYCDGFSCSAKVTISRTDDGAFGFYGADISSFAVGVPPGATVKGEVSGGGTVQFGNYGEGDWLNVVAVNISITSLCTTNCFFDPNAVVQVDDVVLGAAVPIPAAVWLFASGLAGLGWFRRKRSD